MRQAQHDLDYQDLTELRLHEANFGLAKEELERLGGRLVEVFRIERPANVFGDEVDDIVAFTLENDLRPALESAYDHFLVCQFRLIAYTRWYASNDIVKRTTSEFVRSRRPGLHDEINPAVQAALKSDDFQVRGSAWGRLARG